MTRQRVRTHSPRLRVLSRALLLLFALALIWYGLVLVMLAAGLPDDTADLLTGHRTALAFLSSLQPDDLTPVIRAIAGGVALLAFALFGLLAVKELPRPYLARHGLALSGDERGRVTVEPRALERVAESAAGGHAAIEEATGHWGDAEVTLHVGVRRGDGLVDTLRDVRRRVREALTDHGLPERPVNVTLSGLHQTRQRELQ